MIITNFTPRFTVMQECWSANPDNRPSFSKLVSIFDDMLTSLAGYMDFTQLPIYMSLKSTKNIAAPPKDKDTTEDGQDITTANSDDNYVEPHFVP